MTAAIRVKKSRKTLTRPWRVKYGKQTLGAFDSWREAIDFAWRLLAAAQ